MHVHRLPDVLHLHGVGADDELTKILDAGHRGPSLALERSLAPSHQALIGFELAKHIGPVRSAGQRDAKNFHAGDLQAGLQTVEAGECRLPQSPAALRCEPTTAVDDGTPATTL